VCSGLEGMNVGAGRALLEEPGSTRADGTASVGFGLVGGGRIGLTTMDPSSSESGSAEGGERVDVDACRARGSG
jgi:hypothetical protein